MKEKHLKSFIEQTTDDGLVTTIRNQFKNDIKLFAHQCITEDPHDSLTPWKKLPIDDIPYIGTLLDSYVNDSKILVIKSRQVMVSWIMVVATLWHIMFFKGVRIAYVSKKSEDSRRLIERLKFVYEKLPDRWKPQLDFVSHPLPKVTCPANHSFIFGYPQGAEQARGETFTVIFNDEFAFQEQQKKTYTASKPTIDGGGKFIAVSTPNGQDNLFYQLSKEPSFKIHRIHYSMNPFKNDKWKKEAFSGISESAIQQEYELNFLASINDKIYGDFNAAIHLKPLLLHPEKPLYVGWDFGYNRPAVVFAQLYDGKLLVLDRIIRAVEIIVYMPEKNSA